MTTAHVQETCGEGDCRRPVFVKGRCQTHYERGRERHRHREYGNDRAAQTRARNRATAALVKRHKAEFDLLYDEMIADVTQEMTVLRERAAERGVKAESGVVRLRPGTRPRDEKPADRLREDVGRCPKCHVMHDAGHRCPNCGTNLPVTSEATLARMVCAVCGKDGTARSEPCIDPKQRVMRNRHEYRLAPGAAS